MFHLHSYFRLSLQVQPELSLQLLVLYSALEYLPHLAFLHLAPLSPQVL
jgi:hypothetical protein